jgi:hypothetical protein
MGGGHGWEKGVRIEGEGVASLPFVDNAEAWGSFALFVLWCVLFTRLCLHPFQHTLIIHV